MKTPAVVETVLTENGINRRLTHKTFLSQSATTHPSRAKKNLRKVDRHNYNVLAMLGIEDHTAQLKISLHPEFVAFSFHLYGLSRKLFLYILFYELNNDTCTFRIDKEMMQRFRKFCYLFGEGEDGDKTILQAARSLIRKNTMLALDNETYMLNPLIAGGASENKRRKLIDQYSEWLQKKGLDTSVDFYPRYQLTL